MRNLLKPHKKNKRICSRLTALTKKAKNVSSEQIRLLKTKIEQTAQKILDARAKYPDSSLADLYDETVMPPELRKAHQENDRAVMQAYGFTPKMTESEIVAELFKMYEKLIEGKNKWNYITEAQLLFMSQKF